jgi:hypothetical protein
LFYCEVDAIMYPKRESRKANLISIYGGEWLRPDVGESNCISRTGNYVMPVVNSI